ncbi:MAG: extra-cytoplasmic solute receptor [Ramlibacter sp.]|nr:extra-cytoplasmic solute receptor [Ramlibacter sp.]
MNQPFSSPRRWAVKTLLACIAAVAAGTAAAEYPDKPIRFVLPVSAGGGADVTARHVALRLAKRLGQPILIDNKTGAGGMLAADTVAKAAPDGYTFFWGVMPGYTLLPSLVRQVPYDTAKDLIMVTTVTKYPTILVVHKDVPARTAQELAALLRANPEKYSYGTSEATARFISARFMRKLGVQGRVVHVPYKGAPQQLTDTAAGLLQFGITSMGAIQPFLEGGKLRVLAVLGDNRLPGLPGIPTLAEVGFPDVAVPIANALFAPANTPRVVLERMRADVNAVLHADDPDLKSWLLSSAQEPGGEPVSEAQERFKRDYETISREASELGIRPE